MLLESFIKCVQNMFLTALSTHPFHPLSTSSKHHRPKNVKRFHATSMLVLQHRDFEMEHMGAPIQKNIQYESFDSPGRAHTTVWELGKISKGKTCNIINKRKTCNKPSLAAKDLLSSKPPWYPRDKDE